MTFALNVGLNYQLLVLIVNKIKKEVESKMDSCKSLVKLKTKAQITIPHKICKKLGIKKGDLFKVEVVDKKAIFTPQILVDKF